MRSHAKSRLIASVLIASQFGVLFPATALAQTSVNAVVCGGDSQPAIAITSPETDSTVAATTISVSGTVQHTSSLIVNLDSQYDQTIAIGANQEQFSFAVSTSVGTHTVQITGYGICDNLSATASAVFTSIVPEEPTEPGTTNPGDGSDPYSQPGDISGQNDGGLNENEQNQSTTRELQFETDTEISSLSDGTGMITTSDGISSGIVRPVDVLVAPFSSATTAKVIEYAKVALFTASFSVLVFSEVVTKFVSIRLFHINRLTMILIAATGLLLSLTANV